MERHSRECGPQLAFIAGEGDDVLVVANAKARRVTTGRLDAAVGRLREYGTVAVAVCAVEADLLTALDSRTSDRVVLAGGDGTVHLAVEHLFRTKQLQDVTVGVIPLGAGNDLARAVGIPLDPVGAAEVVLMGTAKPADLIETTRGSIIVNVGHVGVSVQGSIASRWLKPALGRASYAIGAVVAGAAIPASRMTVLVDGESIIDNSPLLLTAVCNGRFIGGGARVCPTASVGDGKLDVVCAAGTTARDRVALALYMRGVRSTVRGLIHVAGHEVSIQAPHGAQVVDGELVQRRPTTAYWVRPSSWRLVIPA